MPKFKTVPKTKRGVPKKYVRGAKNPKKKDRAHRLETKRLKG